MPVCSCIYTYIYICIYKTPEVFFLPDDQWNREKYTYDLRLFELQPSHRGLMTYTLELWPFWSQTERSLTRPHSHLFLVPSPHAEKINHHENHRRSTVGSLPPAGLLFRHETVMTAPYALCPKSTQSFLKFMGLGTCVLERERERKRRRYRECIYI